MKNSLYTLALAALLISITQISNAAGTVVTITKSKKIADDERSVSGFRGISSSGSFDVKITMGNKESLRLEGDDDVIKDIETKVEQGILKIRNKKQGNWNWRSVRNKVTIYVTAKNLNSITLSGSGNISVNGVVKASKLTNVLSGSGSISLTADSDEYSGTLSGSGELDVRGNADRAMIKIAGSGDFDGSNFKTLEADVIVSGSGNVTIRADKHLKAVVSGSGDISYIGNPKVEKTKSGSGSISQL